MEEIILIITNPTTSSKLVNVFDENPFHPSNEKEEYKCQIEPPSLGDENKSYKDLIENLQDFNCRKIEFWPQMGRVCQSHFFKWGQNDGSKTTYEEINYATASQQVNYSFPVKKIAAKGQFLRKINKQTRFLMEIPASSQIMIIFK